MTLPDRSEREALNVELDRLEATPPDGGLGDMLRASLIERVEQRLDVIGRVASDETQADPGGPHA